MMLLVSSFQYFPQLALLSKVNIDVVTKTVTCGRGSF